MPIVPSQEVVSCHPVLKISEKFCPKDLVYNSDSCTPPNNISQETVETVHSPPAFHNALNRLSQCFPNVIIASEKVRVLRGNITLVLANLNCMTDLLHSPVKWKYMINLCAKDFPLKTNYEIVERMKAYNGHNAVNGLLIARTPDGHTAVNGHIEKNKPNLERVLDRWTYHHVFESYDKYPQQSEVLKSPPPHNITVYKGNTYIAATRKFVDFIINDKEAQDFLLWLYDTKTPDESYTPSLQRHPRAPRRTPFPVVSAQSTLYQVDETGERAHLPREASAFRVCFRQRVFERVTGVAAVVRE